MKVKLGAIKRKLSKEKNLVIILVVLSFFLFFFRLGAPSLFETDEVIYSQIAREIVRTGDWITLHLHSQKWFIHPPLYMWLVSLSSFIFGSNEFNSRFWCALFGIGLVYLTYLLGKKMFRNGVGILAGFILATSFQFIIQSRLAIFDVPLAFFMVLSIYLFLCSLKKDKENYYYMFFAAMGLGTLMKGPVALLLPLMVLVPYLAITKNLKALFNIKIFKGIAIYLAIGGTWYLVESILHGREFIDRVVGFYLIKRYLGPIETHSGPWFYYFVILLIGLLPWSVFLPFSLYYQVKRIGDENNLFTVIWIMVIFLFFSMAGTKLPGYIIAMYPFISISIAKLIADFAAGEDSGIDFIMKRLYKSLAIFSAILVVMGMFFSLVVVQPQYNAILFDVNIILIMLGLGGLVAVVLFFRTDSVYNSLIALVVTMLIFTFYVSSFTMVHLNDFKPMREISKNILTSYKKGDKVIGYQTMYKSSFIFYLDKPINWIDDRSALAKELYSGGRAFLIVDKNIYYEVIRKIKTGFNVTYRFGDLVLLNNFQKPTESK